MFLRVLTLSLASLLLCAACTEQTSERPSASATQPVVVDTTPPSPAPAIEQPAAMTEPVAPERKTKPFDNTALLVGTVKILTELQPLLHNPATRIDGEEDGAR